MNTTDTNTPTLTPTDHLWIGGAVLVASGLTSSILLNSFGISGTEFCMGLAIVAAVAVATFVLMYRFIIGEWPWNLILVKLESYLPMSTPVNDPTPAPALVAPISRKKVRKARKRTVVKKRVRKAK